MLREGDGGGNGGSGRRPSRNVLGGTAPEQVRAQIARHRARLGAP